MAIRLNRDKNKKKIIIIKKQTIMEDNKKQISAEFNKVYEDITNAYDGINEFYMKHCSLGQDDIDNRIVPVLADIWDMLGKCKEMGHEVAEHLTWD